jgi:carbon storage regulator
MLILSRKVDEVINIGDKITVKVLAIKDGQVKLGFEAPKELQIYRGELYDAILNQNRAAATAVKASAVRTAGILRSMKPRKPTA